MTWLCVACVDTLFYIVISQPGYNNFTLLLLSQTRNCKYKEYILFDQQWQVLESKKGNPITLAVMFIAIARRLGVKVEPVSLFVCLFVCLHIVYFIYQIWV